MVKDVNDTCILMPLTCRPRIHQAGMGEHGIRREETFFRPKLWALHLYFWEGEVSFGNRKFAIQPHNIGLTPPDTSLTWHFPLKQCRHYFVHFEFKCEGMQGELSELPVMCALGSHFDDVNRRFEEILSWSDKNLIRAEVRLWDLLWELCDINRSVRPEYIVRPGAVETALGIIESELDSNINGKTLAERVGLSYTQLNRLFKENLGSTLASYIAGERLKRAEHLLLDTNLPVKSVAELVGIPDIQHFNKFMRYRTGLAPRDFRNRKCSTKLTTKLTTKIE